MPIITSIKPQKSKNRVNIYLDNKFGFGIDLENFMKLHLKVEQELSEEELNKIIKTAEFQKTLDKILAFGMLRPRSEREFKDWLRRKKVHESMESDLFNKLKYFELLDDTKFAKWWVDQRMQFRKKSKKVIKQELQVKGVDREIIEEVLGEVKIDEKKLISEILAKKYYKWEKLPERERKQKMTEYLLRNGFDWSQTETAIDDFDQKR